MGDAVQFADERISIIRPIARRLPAAVEEKLCGRVDVLNQDVQVKDSCGNAVVRDGVFEPANAGDAICSEEPAWRVPTG